PTWIYTLSLHDALPILVSFHGPNEVEVAGRLVERIVERRERLVCVTDAGMPGISDPGERLVVAALAAGVAVEVVPGPSAALSALDRKSTRLNSSHVAIS